MWLAGGEPAPVALDERASSVTPLLGPVHGARAAAGWHTGVTYLIRYCACACACVCCMCGGWARARARALFAQLSWAISDEVVAFVV